MHRVQQPTGNSFRPHEFQEKLAQNGIKRVTNIVCVMTGAGKTLIAAMICKHWDNKFNSEKKRQLRAAFIVPTRFLAEQQKVAFEKLFDPDSLMVITEKHTSAMIKACSNKACVIFLTAQKLLNALHESQIELRSFDILVFDECHHTYDSHPYNMVMGVYFVEKHSLSPISSSSSLPLIIGLTASLGTNTAKDPILQIKTLCANLDCETISFLNDEEEAEMYKRIRSPLADQVVSVEQSAELLLIRELTTVAMSHILNKIGLGILIHKIGKQEFENNIIDQKSMAEANDHKDKITGTKYLIELNSFYNNLDDMDMPFCLQQLQDFLGATAEGIKSKTEIEKFCIDKTQKLLEFTKDKLANNNKLLALVELIKKCHRANSRGSLSNLVLV